MPSSGMSTQNGFARNRTLKLEKGLYLLEGKGAKSYAARAWRNGSWDYIGNLGTDMRAAEQAALLWFRRLNSASGPGGESMATAASLFLASIADEGKRANHDQHWQAIRDFFSPGMGRDDVLVSEVTSPKLMDFVSWKREKSAGVSASTIRKDLVTVRQILKHAVMRGIIPNLPMFPVRSSHCQELPFPLAGLDAGF